MISKKITYNLLVIGGNVEREEGSINSWDQTNYVEFTGDRSLAPPSCHS